jgi:hypothetical protein
VQRINTATAQANLNGIGKSGFVERQESTQRAPTLVNADWFNNMQEEVCNVIELAGLILNPNDRTQLAQAIAIASTGSSSANAISIRGISIVVGSPTAGDVFMSPSGTTYAPAKVKNANIDPAAAIVVSKLAAGPDGYLLGSTGGVPTWQNGAAVIRGIPVNASLPNVDDVITYPASGGYTPAKIKNANVDPAAAILPSKLGVNTGTSVDQAITPGLSAGAPSWGPLSTYASVSTVTVANLVVPTMSAARNLMLQHTSGIAFALLGIDTTGWGLTFYPVRRLFSINGAAITLSHNNAGGTVGSRFICPGNADYVLNPYRGVDIIYISSAWYVMPAN